MPNLKINPELAQCIDAIKQACTNWGFFQCINHGIPDDIIEAFDKEFD